MSESRRRRSSNGTKQRPGNVGESPVSRYTSRPVAAPAGQGVPSSSVGGGVPVGKSQSFSSNMSNRAVEREKNNSSSKSLSSTPSTARGKSSNSKAAYTRSQSYDKVRRIVSEEGRQARNLVTWNVPMDDTDDSDDGKPDVRRKPKYRSSASTRSARATPRSNIPRKKSVESPRDASHDNAETTQPGDRSIKTTGPTAVKKVDLRARYWAFLFDNLQRAVDEIYQTCEADESIVECKEVIMILKRATHDFESLIKRINVQKDFEQCDVENRPTSIVWEVRKSSSPAKHRTPSWPPDSRAPTPRRPNSLAWEVRKISPGRGLIGSPTPDSRDTPSPVNRSLNFKNNEATKTKDSNAAPETTTAPPETVMVASWADRVKGHTIRPIAKVPATQILNIEPEEKGRKEDSETRSSDPKSERKINGDMTPMEDDGEGWETVNRSRPNRSRPSSAKNRSQHSSTSSTQSQTGPYPTADTKKIGAYPTADTKRIPQRTASRTNTAPQSNAHRSHADSEKENQPLESSNVSDKLSQIGLEVKGERSEVIQVEGWKEGKMLNSTGQREMREQDVNIQDVDPAIIAVGRTDCLLSSGDELEMDSNRENNTEDDLATKLDEDVNVAIDEEETLTNEIEKCQDEALASAIAEEEKLTKEIEEEESKEIIVETDEGESDLALSTNTLSSLDSSQRTMDWNDIVADFEERQRQQSQSPVNWAEMVEINDIEGRPPGYALHMHEKLSSPSRKRTREEAQRRHEERQAKAQHKRDTLMDEKAIKLKMLHEKIEEVREWKEELLMLKKKEMGEKQHRAEQKRQMQLEAVRRKAQEEEHKANEIAFINSLEAQNKRHDILARHMGHEARLQDIAEERQRKHVEKAAKEEAVQERRKALEEERMARLKEMQKHRQDQEDKLNVLREQRERTRESAVKERARDREQRLSALNAAQQAKEEEIQKKIQQKHDETTRRHNQQIEQKREKAIELSMLRHYRTTDVAPHHNPYENKKMCSLCSVMIPSEVYLLSHLRGKKHKDAILEKHQGKHMTDEEMESYSLKLLVEASPDRPDPQEMAEKERQKGCRKRARKLRQRMSAKGKEYENNLLSKPQGTESQLRAKLQKLIKDLNKYLQSQSSTGPWEQSKVSAMDRALGELNRILAKKELADQAAFRSCGGLSTLSRILMLIDSGSSAPSNPIPSKSVCSAATAFRLACKACFDNCQYALYSGKLAPIVELLVHQLGLITPQSNDQSQDQPQTQSDPISSCLMQLLSTVLLCLVKYRPQSPLSDSRSGAQKKQMDMFDQCGQDLISYLVCCGVIDNLTSYFNRVQGTVEENPSLAEFLQHSLGLLGAMIKFVSAASTRSTNLGPSKKEDPTQLLATFRATGFGGIVSLLYGILLHGGNPTRSSTATPRELPEHMLNVATAGIKMLSSIAALDLQMMQSALGAEGISLEFRHIATYLIWHCSHFASCEDLLHEVILIVGYFTVLNAENQVLVQSGNTPSLLQQLCGLPFQYFSDPRLTMVLFPTLMACCYNNAENKTILEQEMSCSLLSCFLEEKIQDKKKAKHSPTTPKIRDKDKDFATRTSFELRFPESVWDDALEFFGDGAS